MAAQRGREFWERAVREVEAGASQMAVGRRYGVASSTVGHWVRRLRGARADEAASTALVPVRVAGEPRRRIEIVVGATRIEFDEGTDPSYVAAVVRAVGSC